jgi:hypothetical protein
MRLDSPSYVRRVAAVFDTSIGAHVRHNVDHYLSFLDGVAAGRIDYHTRARDSGIESELAQGLWSLQEVARRLQGLPSFSQLLLVRAEGPPGQDVWQVSSAARELEFLLSHTVHHHALIAVICRNMGIPVEDGFGIAPSTLRYRACCE